MGTPSWYFCVSLTLTFVIVITFDFCSRLPPSEEGEWWELSDDSRGGLPYYYQTKTGETVWERPSGFVIPLSILQVSSHTVFLSPSTFSFFMNLRATLWIVVYHNLLLTTSLK